MNMRSISDMICDHKPVTIAKSETVKMACCRMRDCGVGAVLVTDKQNRLLGIFTGRDAVVRMLAEGRDPATTAISKVMTPSPKTLSPEMTAIDALRLMHDGGFRHIPITDQGKVTGLVSRGDFRGIERARLDDEVELWERL